MRKKYSKKQIFINLGEENLIETNVTVWKAILIQISTKIVYNIIMKSVRKKMIIIIIVKININR